MVTKTMQSIDEINEMFEKFAYFHDDYFAGIEIKFEDYKAINDDGESTGITSANKTVILLINVIPYGKNHNRIVRMELKGVKSFEVSAPNDKGNWWGIGQILPRSEGDNIKLDMDFIGDEAKLEIVCPSIKIEYNEKDFNFSPSRKRFS